MNSMKRQKDMTLGDDPQIRRHPACYWGKAEAIPNSSRKNEAAILSFRAKEEMVLSCDRVWW